MKTEIEVLGKSLEEDERILKRGAEIIKNGGLVAFPTETVYGLGANALDTDAAAKIYAAKGRPSDNPLIIHISDVKQAELYAYVPEAYKLLAEKFLPGPLTVVMKKKDNVPSGVTGGLDTVAVRLPLDKNARRLIELAGVPIAAPSANLSGKPSTTCARHVIEDMDGRIDMIIDGGDCKVGLESTIVKLDESGATLLRPGKITHEELEDVLGEVKLDKAVTDKLDSGEKPLAPGMKYKHYAPKAKLTLIDGDDEFFYGTVKKHLGSTTAVICFDEDTDILLKMGCKDSNLLSLGSKCDKDTNASRLFKLLRRCDEENFEFAYSRLPDKKGISLAIYNRIIKASGYSVIKQ